MAIDGIAIVTGAMPAVSSNRSNGSARAKASERGPGAPQPSAGGSPVQGNLPDVRAQLESLAKVMQEAQSNLSFSVHESTGKTVVRVVRRSTGEVVRQIPTEEALAIAETLKKGAAVTSLGLERWS